MVVSVKRRIFVFFCIFVRSEPTVEQLYEMGMDNVCPAVVDQLELDSDEQLVNFVADTWYIPRPTKEERAALKAALFQLYLAANCNAVSFPWPSEAGLASDPDG